MREILFKGKTCSEVSNSNLKPNNEWVYGFYYDRIGLPTIREFDFKYGNYIDYEIDRKTLGRFTDLTDKNDKKLFEGDIVKFNNQIGTIINEYGSWGIGINECINYKRLEVYIEDKTKNFYSGVYNDNFISLWEIYWNCNAIDNKIKEIEVIGNKWDNPELLEK